MGAGTTPRNAGRHYRAVFSDVPFRRFWIGFTVSSLGDAMTRVALTWLVLQRTHSAQALGLLTVAYTAPILVGGFAAGALLDRFGRQKVMAIDNAARGTGVAVLAVLSLLGRLSTPALYVFAALYGLLMMISLAGSPALMASLVPPERRDTANALETLSFTLSGVAGPPLAGLALTLNGSSALFTVDALSYAAFAFVLSCIVVARPAAGGVSDAPASAAPSLRATAALLVKRPALLSTTVMFAAANIGWGMLSVALPLYAAAIGGGGAGVYGGLLGVMAGGEIAGALAAGLRTRGMSVGLRIAVFQVVSGLGCAVFLVGARIVPAVGAAAIAGFFSAPLTVWAQTLRMKEIPAEHHGRAFALLRTVMQGATPLGGAAAGLLVPGLGVFGAIAACAAVIGVPGLLGLTIRGLREADA